MEVTSSDGKRELPLPAGWEDWPLDEQGDFLAWKLNRAGLLDELRERIDKSDRDSDRLSADEMGRLLALLADQ
jgi:hypothetical protein